MKSLVLLLFIIYAVLIAPGFPASAQPPKVKKSKPLMPKVIRLEEQLAYFDKKFDSASYRISLCADMPYDKNPLQVTYGQEPGHVFLILQKINLDNMGDTINLVFGFYPSRGIPLIFKRKMKSRIKDNSSRYFDIRITKEVSEDEFNTFLQKSLSLSRKYYHLNKYNCYDYGVELFNTLVTHDRIPLRRTKYPFPFGSGGSPVCIYSFVSSRGTSLKEWNYEINLGGLLAPKSTGR
ncbi:MAG TPA: hypothetical protein VGD33_05250 [Chitinophagaceae bacterium]